MITSPHRQAILQLWLKMEWSSALSLNSTRWRWQVWREWAVVIKVFLEGLREVSMANVCMQYWCDVSSMWEQNIYMIVGEPASWFIPLSLHFETNTAHLVPTFISINQIFQDFIRCCRLCKLNVVFLLWIATYSDVWMVLSNDILCVYELKVAGWIYDEV